jgi:hypothetical protein
MDNTNNNNNNNNSNNKDGNNNKPVSVSVGDNINKIDNINYITLETMANSDTYNKYLKRNNLDHTSVLKSEKRFYRKRIAAMAKDILNNNINNNNDSPINDVIINAFNTFARLCISHFKFKDTMDNIQGDYKDMVTGSDVNLSNSLDNIDGPYMEDSKINMDEANKLFMKQVDKKVITMDNFVTKTSPPQDEMIVPQTKEFNLKDPKYKKKDIKKGNTKIHISRGVKCGDTNEVIDITVSKKGNTDT